MKRWKMEEQIDIDVTLYHQKCSICQKIEKSKKRLDNIDSKYVGKAKVTTFITEMHLLL